MDDPIDPFRGLPKGVMAGMQCIWPRPEAQPGNHSRTDCRIHQPDIPERLELQGFIRHLVLRFNIKIPDQDNRIAGRSESRSGITFTVLIGPIGWFGKIDIEMGGKNVDRANTVGQSRFNHRLGIAANTCGVDGGIADQSPRRTVKCGHPPPISPRGTRQPDIMGPELIIPDFLSLQNY